MVHCGLHSDYFDHTGVLSVTHVNLDFYHSFFSFDLKQSEKYRISVTRLTERFVPPSWMPAAPPGHEAARVFEGLDVCLLLGHRLISFRSDLCARAALHSARRGSSYTHAADCRGQAGIRIFQEPSVPFPSFLYSLFGEQCEGCDGAVGAADL